MIARAIVEKATILVIVAIIVGILFSGLVLEHLMPLIPLFLVGMMGSAGLMISFKDLFKSGIKPSRLSVIISSQYIVSVVIGFILAVIFFIMIIDAPNLALGQVLHGAMPSEQTTPVWIRLAGGNVALGITTLIISTFASPFASPALVFAFAGTWIEFDYYAMFLSMILVVLIPVLAGSFIRTIKTQSISKHDHIYHATSTLFALPTIVIIGALAASFIYSQPFMLLVLAVMASSIHFGSTLFSGFVIPKVLRWEFPDVPVSVYNLSMKEFTVTLSVIAATGLNPEVGVPAALYGIMHMATAPIIARYMRRKYAKE